MTAEDKTHTCRLLSDEGCTRHPGELIQEYCETCNELLCTQCLRAGHQSREHKLLSYFNHLRDRKREALKLSKRFENIKHEINELHKLFQVKKERFYEGLQNSAEKVKSFQEVHRAMSGWEVRNTNTIMRQNSKQVQSLEEARRKGSKSVQIERPKILIRTKAIAGLHNLIKELTPNLILSVTGASAFSRHSRTFSQALDVPWAPAAFLNIRPKIAAKPDDSELAEYDYIASSVSSVSTCSNGSSGKSLPVAGHKNPPSTEPFPGSPSRTDRPVHRPVARKRTSVPTSRPVSHPYHSSPKFEPKGEGRDIDIYGSTIDESDKEDDYDDIVTSRSKENPPPTVPSRNDTLEAGYDEEYVYSSPPEPYEMPALISAIEETYDLPYPPSEEGSHYTVCEPVGRQPSNQYDKLLTDSTTENAYTYIDNEVITELSPPPLPPRRGIKATTIESEIYDEPIYHNVSDPKPIILKDINIILNGLAAATPSESVMLHDVCTGPLGSMIFTDQESSCVRILMTVDEKPHKSTKAMKCQLQAVTYDQKNSRIIVASEKGLYQLEFDETKPNKAKSSKLFLKDNYCISITSTKPTRGEDTLIYAVTKKHEETFISCFKQNGQFVNKLDVKGKPCCIAYKDGYLVVATSQDKNLNKINTSGSPLWDDDDVDARKKGVLANPFQVAILPNHNIAVSEKRQHCISVFSKEGQHILRFGQFGDKPGTFNEPTGIAIRLEKELVVVDSGNKRIQIFTLDELAKEFEVAVIEKERAEKEESDDDDNTIEL